LELNLDYIAITDHYTNSWKEGFSKLKNNEDISEYLEIITRCQLYLKGNQKKLTLFKGLEIDLDSTEHFINQLHPNEFELILFEYLQTMETIAFVKNIVDNWKRSSKSKDHFPILGLAHFDPSYFIHGNLEILISFLKKYNIYFEFNASYSPHFSRRNEKFFDAIRESNIPVAIGSDSHSISNLDNIEEPLEMIKYYNLEDNLQMLIKKLRE
jgi:histidinol phosphatase-like PHP family hydrolase